MHAQLAVECVACLHKCCIKSLTCFLKFQLKYLADILTESGFFSFRRIMQREYLCIKYVILSIVDSCACIETQKTKLSSVNVTRLKLCITYSFCP